MILGRLLAPYRRRMLQAQQARRAAQFTAAPPTSGRVVFLGDSITEWALWEDWFPELRTCNRGIAGQGIADVIARLDTALVDPLAVVLLVGTNDLPSPRRAPEIAPIAAAMAELVARIRAATPGAELLINGVLPRSAAHRPMIETLNQAYRAIAAQTGAVWVETWPTFAGPDGAIRKEFSYDQLHLTAEGYRAWTDLLRPHLAGFARCDRPSPI